MVIYSWNMQFRNRELDRAFEFVSKSDFDIFCLQEVPEAFLARLKALPVHLAQATDADRLFHYPHRAYIVTFSRYPITAEKTISYPGYWHEIPWYGKLTTYILRPIGWSRPENRHALLTMLDMPSGKVRLYNLHLTLAAPHRRLREFEEAISMERDQRTPAVVCGDFNIVESPRVSLLNWLLGGRASDALCFRRERTHIEKRFVEHELVNPLRGRVTHAFAGSQLDHILVSSDLTVDEAGVIPDRYGSDHYPIRAVISGELRAQARS